jgi:branched-subunit amino acid ABC-type transport system permease component
VAFFLRERVNGITTGALYTLVALSFTMVYKVFKLLNLAQAPAADASSSNVRNLS